MGSYYKYCSVSFIKNKIYHGRLSVMAYTVLPHFFLIVVAKFTFVVYAYWALNTNNREMTEILFASLLFLLVIIILIWIGFLSFGAFY